MAGLPDDWWPDFIPALGDAQFTHGEYVTVAEKFQPSGRGSYRQVFTALAPSPVAATILSTPGSIGYEVSATGPHISLANGADSPGYQPRFWIFGGEAAPDGLEPLVVSWTSANTTVLRIDQGFVMTYGLVPRVIRHPDGQIDEHWDDNEEPRSDIIVSRPLSTYDFSGTTHSWVRVHREFLEDYAFLRDRCLLQVVYGHADGAVSGEHLDALRESKSVQLLQPGRDVVVHLKDDTGRVHVRYWAVRQIIEPTAPTITAGGWDYGELRWPGLDAPITDPHRMPLMDFVYVGDEVLGAYEGRAADGFRIHPESGAVSYRSQWAVSDINRIGRDLLRLEVRKLYEGGRPQVVRHWHSFAVDPPASDSDLCGQPNVATRSKNIVFGLICLGEAVADLASLALDRPVSSGDTVGLTRGSVEYHGWWNAPHVDPVTRHIPLGLERDRFLDRMTDLWKLVVEALSERTIRQVILALGYRVEDTKHLRSVQLLGYLVRHCAVAVESGLHAIRDAPEIIRRASDEPHPGETDELKAVNALRLLDAHRSDASARAPMDEALEVFGIDSASTTAGWGEATDRVYDGVAAGLDGLVETIQAAVDRAESGS